MSSDASLSFSCPLPVIERPEVLLGHGSGGTLTAELLEKLFLPAFANAELERRDDSARLALGAGELAFTTDAFVVSPLFFPGGDIGRLAVHGTVNDLAVAGAEPLWLAAAFVLEEGLAIEDLRRVVLSMRAAADEAGVTIVTGDTKVVGRGAADRMFVTTSGIGRMRPGIRLAPSAVRPGDAVLVSGTLGDHGVAILSAREDLGLAGEIESDSAPLHRLAAALVAAAPGTRAMRDATRGGLAAVVHEIAAASAVAVELDEAELPVREAVRGACEILGLDPLLVANEGKLVAFVPAEEADAALAALRADPLGREAALVGRVTDEAPGEVSLRTAIGGTRLLERPYGELLPRIC